MARADLARCIGEVAGVVCGIGDSYHMIICRALREALECAERGLSMAFYSMIKLALETAAQYAYYRSRGVDVEESLRLVSRRSRAAASFTGTMLRRIRGVHGPVKSWIIRTYLKVSENVHPSIALHRSSGSVSIDHEVVLNALDAIMYLLALFDRGRLRVVEGCGLERALRVLRPRPTS